MVDVGVDGREESVQDEVHGDDERICRQRSDAPSIATRRSLPSHDESLRHSKNPVVSQGDD